MAQPQVPSTPDIARIEKPSCKTCKHFGSMVAQNQNIVTICRYKPPRVFAHVIAVNNSGQVAWATNTAWPAASPDDRCGRHESELLRKH